MRRLRGWGGQGRTPSRAGLQSRACTGLHSPELIYMTLRGDVRDADGDARRTDEISRHDVGMTPREPGRRSIYVYT